MDHFAYDIILGNLPDSPAVAEIIEALRLA